MVAVNQSVANLDRLSYRESARWALFLDFDGTLVDIAPSPQAVKVEPELLDLLRSLACSLNGALALISGRPIEQLDSYLKPLRLPSAGLHGVTLRLSSDSGVDVDSKPMPAQLQQKLLDLASAYQGCWLEYKEVGSAVYCLAVHCRQAPEHEAVLRDRVVELLAGFSPEWTSLFGNKVIEIKPGGYSKGTAVQAFMQQAPFEGRIPVFIGDDVTDQAGFAIVHQAKGYAIAVGEITSEQGWWLPDAAGVRQWLGFLAGHLHAEHLH